MWWVLLFPLAQLAELDAEPYGSSAPGVPAEADDNSLSSTAEPEFCGT